MGLGFDEEKKWKLIASDEGRCADCLEDCGTKKAFTSLMKRLGRWLGKMSSEKAHCKRNWYAERKLTL